MSNTSPQAEDNTTNEQTPSAEKEIDIIPFAELARPFAAGKLRIVDASLNFREVVQAMLDNNSAKIKAWIASEKIRLIDDGLAEQWFLDNPSLIAAVVAPFVVVQAPE